MEPVSVRRSSSTSRSRCKAAAEFHDASSAGSSQKFFFVAQRFQRQKAVGQHDQRHMVMPPAPTATLVVVQSEFFLELLIILLDFPARFGDLYEAPKAVD